MPAECDVSIRPGWFWHPAENGKVKTPQELFDLYCVSTGRGASFLLNVPPDRRGLIQEADAESLRGFGRMMNAKFAHNLAAGAKVKASPTEFVYNLRKEATFDLVRVKEDIALGQRIGGFTVDYWKDGAWTEFASAPVSATVESCASNNPCKANASASESPIPPPRQCSRS